MDYLINFRQKNRFEKHHERALEVEREYELATLSYAIKNQDEQEIKRSKKRLVEIHHEIEALNIGR